MSSINFFLYDVSKKNFEENMYLEQIHIFSINDNTQI